MCAKRRKAIYTNSYICGKGKSEPVLVSRLLFPSYFWLLTTGGRGEGRIGSFETKLENVLWGLEEEEGKMHSDSSSISGLVISASASKSALEQAIEHRPWNAFLSFNSRVLLWNSKLFYNCKTLKLGNNPLLIPLKPGSHIFKRLEQLLVAPHNCYSTQKKGSSWI